MSNLSAFGQRRPVLFGAVRPPTAIPPPTGRDNSRIRFVAPQSSAARLDGQMSRAARAFTDDIQLTDQIAGADPQLVLVFEALDERTDLSRVALSLGLELLIDVEGAVDPDEEVELTSERAIDPQITSCMHAICVSRRSMESILVAWRTWRRTGAAPHGFGPLGKLFDHLREVRPWGPEDRVRGIDWIEYFDGRLPGATHLLEVELWYRANPATREAVVSQVEAHIHESGGEVVARADQSSTGYLALKCRVPDAVVRSLASGDWDAVQLVRSAHVLFLRIQGQGLPTVSEEAPLGEADEWPLPSGLPRVAILDGIPASNHPLLAGRVQVVDPDDLASDTEATVDKRKHGTWMTSAVVWGDRSSGEPPLESPVVARPVLLPSMHSLDQVEEFPDGVLVPDLMEIAVRDLFEGEDSGLTIVNLSLGDPALPFDNIVSSWARTLDWLSYQYGVLFVVSAGNHRLLPLHGHDSVSLMELTGKARSEAVGAAMRASWSSRRILSPGESINALTVGALHMDASSQRPVGYTFDPHDGRVDVSPISGLGGGHRRAIKPDVAVSGGRVTFSTPLSPEPTVSAARTPGRSGIRVAAPAGGEAFVVGTSPAAALTSRRLARLVDLAEEISPEPLSRSHRAVAAKAMLIHGARHPEDFSTDELPLEHAIGYGAVERDLVDGCQATEATILYTGELKALQEQELVFPLVDGLSTRDIKRVIATVAWLSPINWRHRQYRRAQLKFAKPSGLVELPAGRDLPDAVVARGSATVKHMVWETDRASARGPGDEMSLRVKCYEQAGGLQGMAVPYAAVVSLQLAEGVGVDVYTQVAQQLRSRISVASRR